MLTGHRDSPSKSRGTRLPFPLADIMATLSSDVYYPGTEEAHTNPRASEGSASEPSLARFDVALFSTDFITRPGIPWGNCFG